LASSSHKAITRQLPTNRNDLIDVPEKIKTNSQHKLLCEALKELRYARPAYIQCFKSTPASTFQVNMLST